MTDSPLVLGAMLFGVTIDESRSFALLDRFVERGGVWIDTADCYAFWASEGRMGGESEALLGRWLAARPGVRDRVRISTKLGADPRYPGDWPTSRAGLSGDAVARALAGSLDRLGVDRVDLLWLHMEDRDTPIEETVEALAVPTSDGTVLRVGASNHPAWRVERARAHAVSIGARPIDALQLNRTYLRPAPDAVLTDHRFGVMQDEQIDIAVEEHLELWAYTPLLGGAYDNPAKPLPDAYRHPVGERQLAELTSAADELGVPSGQVVLAWLWGGTPAIRPILGGSRLEQLDSAMDALELALPDELRTRLDVAAGPMSTGPAYTPIVTGREETPA